MLGDEVRVTVIAAGFDKAGAGNGSRLSRLTSAAREPERAPVPSILQDEEQEDEMFKPTPSTVVFDAEEDLDVPDFLKS